MVTTTSKKCLFSSKRELYALEENLFRRISSLKSKASICCIFLDYEQRRLFVATRDGFIKVFQISSLRLHCQFKIEQSSATKMWLLSDQRTLVVLTFLGSIVIFDLSLPHIVPQMFLELRKFKYLASPDSLLVEIYQSSEILVGLLNGTSLWSWPISNPTLPSKLYTLPGKLISFCSLNECLIEATVSQ